MKRLFFVLLVLSVSLPAWATCIFREDTGSQTFLIGPFLDGTDGISAETGLTLTAAEIRISKAGGNTVAKNSGNCTHDENGMYQCTFDATDTNTAGMLQIYTDNSIGGTSVVPVFHECMVYAVEFFDLIDGTTTLLNSRQTGNRLETTVATVTSPTVLILTAGASNDDAYNDMTIEVVGGTEECERQVLDYTGSTTTATLDSACPFTVAAADIVRIHIGGSGHALEIIDTSVNGLNNLSQADVNAEVDSALVDIGLDHWAMIQGTADSGTTSTLVDSALTQPNFYWNNSVGLMVIFSTGPEVACVRSFTASSDTLGFVPAFTQAVATEDYILYPDLSCRNFP